MDVPGLGCTCIFLSGQAREDFIFLPFKYNKNEHLIGEVIYPSPHSHEVVKQKPIESQAPAEGGLVLIRRRRL